MGQAVVSVDVFWGPSLQLSLHRGGSNTARELKQPQLSHAMCPCGALAVAPKWAWGGLRGYGGSGGGLGGPCNAATQPDPFFPTAGRLSRWRSEPELLHVSSVLQ